MLLRNAVSLMPMQVQRSLLPQHANDISLGLSIWLLLRQKCHIDLRTFNVYTCLFQMHLKARSVCKMWLPVALVTKAENNLQVLVYTEVSLHSLWHNVTFSTMKQKDSFFFLVLEQKHLKV